MFYLTSDINARKIPTNKLFSVHSIQYFVGNINGYLG